MSDEMQILDIGGLEGPLGQRVYTALRDGILDMSLHPGMVLRKGALCEQLGVSRSPVAEALGRLSSEGLVDVIPQSATRVSQLFLADLLEECFLREAVEVAAVTKVTLERTDEQLTKLTRNLRLQGLLVDDKDFQGFFDPKIISKSPSPSLSNAVTVDPACRTDVELLPPLKLSAHLSLSLLKEIPSSTPLSKKFPQQRSEAL